MKNLYFVLFLFLILHSSFSQDGTRDSSLNVVGLVEINFNIPGNLYYGTAASKYPDDKIVLGGYAEEIGSSRAFVLSRVMKDGSLDSSFNNYGKSIISIGSEQYSYIQDLAVLADGSTIAAGTCKNNFSNSLRNALAIVKLDPSGVLDQNFDGDGKLILRLGRSNTYDACIATGIAVQSDGKIVIGGTAFNSNGVSSILIVRLNNDGTFDNSFGTNGVFIDESITSNTYINDILIDNNGRIIVCGKSYVADYDFIIARLNANGTFDSTFGTNGKVVYDITGKNDEAFNIGLTSANKILISGQTTSFDHQSYQVIGIDAAIFQLNSDGSLNKLFGNNGFKLINTDQPFNLGKTFVQINDNIYFTGGRKISYTSTYYETFIAKLDPSGNFDNSFGTNGIVIQQAESFEKSILLSDNNLLIVGGDGYVDGLKIFTSSILSSNFAPVILNESAKIFPNPSNSKNIEISLPSNYELEKVTLISTLGISEIYYTKQIKSNLNGMVTVVIDTNKGTITKKVFIQE